MPDGQLMTKPKKMKPLDPRELRNALGRFATGVTVITTCTPQGVLVGLTANSFSALSLEPPLVLWSLKNTSSSLQAFLGSGHFAINVLSLEQRHLSQQFATSAADKFAGVRHRRGHGSCPLLEGALATFECSLEQTSTGGDHILFIGRVHQARYADGVPLLFSAGRYCATTPLGDPAPSTAEIDSIWDGLGLSY
jgi:flavin reductase (DIM6/NTAB) family NADH-FMN oxidoreductase RutF